VNVRLQSGKPDAAKDGRARASAKPHSDIWAGDPASGIIVFLSMLGDPKQSGIRFFKPERFPKSFVRKLEDFDEGASLMRGAKEIASFDNSGWFLVDPYVIHQTTKLGSGVRISLDFRFVPKQSVASDSNEDAARTPFFIDYETWARLGEKTLIATQEGLHEFSPNQEKDLYTTGYPVKLTLIDIESAHAAKLKKAAS
jgi:hypothetical protein